MFIKCLLHRISLRNMYFVLGQICSFTLDILLLPIVKTYAFIFCFYWIFYLFTFQMLSFLFVSPLQTTYLISPRPASMSVLPQPPTHSHLSALIALHWRIEPSQDQGPLFPLKPDNSIFES